ncbi:MAG: hypothetical protein P4L72_09100 [Parvibaculum sp.]|jgi:hypothetical protein|uniref:hypothetical protein n=1 Tax=Parvibaculum sp. TaxID=2024848 RepID=UPI0011BE2BAF|nr:hypothetical protein [Parvibaculum sp.]MDR3499370.1 hypothetical protein [Parvibaculum sp.]
MEDILPLWATLAILAASIVGIGFFAWLERRPREFGRVRFITPTPLIFLCVFVTIIMLVHLRSYYGVEPQPRLR